MEGARPVRAARGTTLTARSWQTEAPLRMLMNNLDPDVAERPDDLVVYGGTGRAARSWPAFDAMVRTLTDLRAPLQPAAATGAVVRALREAGVAGPGTDRYLAPEIERAVALVADGGVIAAAESVTGPLS